MISSAFAPEPAIAERPPRSFHRVLRGPGEDPAWARPALAGLLAATAVLYVWGLGASGWANSFYAAAVQAGAHSWEAFFFGSSDAANFITVDKTPLALWPMDLTARVFGVNSWSLLVPQALMGVATVAVLHATVRRSLRPMGVRAATGGALLAGAVLATTPVAALMFRFNNPDALLALLLTLGAYALLRAREEASTRWLLLAATFVGLGFLAKMLQAFLVMPAFGLVYLVTAPTGLGHRLWQLALAGVAMVVSAGWWVAIVAAIPAGSRPYIGGSQRNSVLELALGYNGLGRLSGNETGGLGNTNQDAGWLRMFDPELGGQIAWLLPAALVLLLAGLWATAAGRRELSADHHTPTGDARRSADLARGRLRTDRSLAAFVLWGGWLLVTDVVFSLMQGIFHGYYTVALAPPIAALTGIGATVLWLNRRRPAATIALAVAVALTAGWCYRLLGRTPDFVPWLRYPVLIGGLIAAVTLLAWRRLPARVLIIGAAIAIAASLAGPAAYAIDTATTPQHGAIPAAGPSSGGPGGARGGFPGGTRGGVGRPPSTGRAGMPQPPGGNGAPFRRPGLTRGGGGQGGGMRAGGTGGPSALLDAATPSATLTAYLKQQAGSYTWAAATVGSNSAAGYQLATGKPVMAIGGFNGTDPAPSLSQFEQYVREGKIHYFISGSMMRAGAASGSGSAVAQQISAWVAKTFTAQTVDGTTVYDLSP